jgi:hypothetical protein
LSDPPVVYRDVAHAMSEKPLKPVPNVQGIYNVLFTGPIPPVLRERFLRAWELIQQDYSDGEIAALEHATATCPDLEALELVCRKSGRLRILTDLVRMMAVLAETMPSHTRFFIASDCSKPKAVLSLVFGFVRTLTKFIFGLFLKRHVAH